MLVDVFFIFIISSSSSMMMISFHRAERTRSDAVAAVALWNDVRADRSINPFHNSTLDIEVFTNLERDPLAFE
jgi:hypothetical protein